MPLADIFFVQKRGQPTESCPSSAGELDVALGVVFDQQPQHDRPLGSPFPITPVSFPPPPALATRASRPTNPFSRKLYAVRLLLSPIATIPLSKFWTHLCVYSIAEHTYSRVRQTQLASHTVTHATGFQQSEFDYFHESRPAYSHMAQAFPPHNPPSIVPTQPVVLARRTVGVASRRPPCRACKWRPDARPAAHLPLHTIRPAPPFPYPASFLRRGVSRMGERTVLPLRGEDGEEMEVAVAALVAADVGYITVLSAGLGEKLSEPGAHPPPPPPPRYTTAHAVPRVRRLKTVPHPTEKSSCRPLPVPDLCSSRTPIARPPAGRPRPLRLSQGAPPPQARRLLSPYRVHESLDRHFVDGAASLADEKEFWGRPPPRRPAPVVSWR